MVSKAAPFLAEKMDDSAADASTESTIDSTTLNDLRIIRVKLQAMQAMIERIRKGSADYSDTADFFKDAVHDINRLLDVSALSSETSNLAGNDSVALLQVTWEQMRHNPLLKDASHSAEKAIDPQAILKHADLLLEQAKTMVFAIGYLTIPARINDWLKNVRSDYAVPFHFVFNDELPDENDRNKMLNYLLAAPAILTNGIVDANTGLISRYDPQRTERWKSIWAVAGALVLMTLLVIGACYLPFKDWQLSPDNVGTLFAGWLATLVGIVVHALVGDAKRRRQTDGLSFSLPLRDLDRIIDARLGYYIRRLLLAFVGFFGLVFAVKVGSINVVSAFFVGYGLDSFIDLFASTVDNQVNTRVAALKQSLG